MEIHIVQTFHPSGNWRIVDSVWFNKGLAKEKARKVFGWVVTRETEDEDVMTERETHDNIRAERYEAPEQRPKPSPKPPKKES